MDDTQSQGAPAPADAGDARLIAGFGIDGPRLVWYVQNDNVMGGRSQGGFDIEGDELVFSGSTNTNGGGFSSIRSEPVRLDLSDYDGIRLFAKGDGRRYTWQLQTDARWRRYRVSYWAYFQFAPGEWRHVDIPFVDFFPQFRGYLLDGPALDTARVSEMGLYIYDGLDGPFALRVKAISAYRGL